MALIDKLRNITPKSETTLLPELGSVVEVHIDETPVLGEVIAQYIHRVEARSYFEIEVDGQVAVIPFGAPYRIRA